MTGAPLVVPVFLPHAGCSHRCVFCDQYAITRTHASLPAREAISAQIRRFLSQGRPRALVEISFYGGNFLGLAPDIVRGLLALAQEFVDAGPVHGIRFSTRPDTVTPETLDWLRPFRVRTVEIGAQSMDDDVLAVNRRGHSAADTERAVALLKEHGHAVGLQMMVGLPGQTDDGALETGRRLAALGPDFVRIYPTVVLADSVLARWMAEGRYRPLDLDQAVTLTATLYRLFADRGIPVARMGLQADEILERTGVVAGPWHPAFGHLVHCALFLDRTIRALEAAGFSSAVPRVRKTGVRVAVHPRNVSRARGHRNTHIDRLRRLFGLEEVVVAADPSAGPEEIRVAEIRSPRERRRSNHDGHP